MFDFSVNSEAENFEMCQDRIIRAKASALAHFLFCALSLFLLALLFNLKDSRKILVFIYYAFCVVWCVNDVIGIRGFDDKKTTSFAVPY